MDAASQEDFKSLIMPITDFINKRLLDDVLETELNEVFPATGLEFKLIESACYKAIKDGWMCRYEAGGIKYGRVIKPQDDLKGFSVDVVEMDNIRGPYHSHPYGEVDMIIPIEGDAQFDGKGVGWKVYSVGSSHCPTVTGGRALILYLLPNGEIKF